MIVLMNARKFGSVDGDHLYDDNSVNWAIFSTAFYWTERERERERERN